MPNTLIVQDQKTIQQADNQVWLVANNPNTVIFDEPFADDLYALDVGPDQIVHEVPNSRTASGFQVNVDSNTTEGKYVVSGTSDEFRSSGLVPQNFAGLIQRGKKSLSAGINKITFPMPFSDGNYSFIPNKTNVDVQEILGTNFPESVEVFAADDCPNFGYIAIGS